jgi:hypothetical protein
MQCGKLYLLQRGYYYIEAWQRECVAGWFCGENPSEMFLQIPQSKYIEFYRRYI